MTAITCTKIILEKEDREKIETAWFLLKDLEHTLELAGDHTLGVQNTLEDAACILQAVLDGVAW